MQRVENKNYINHIDGNRLNNRVGNLEWCNHKENNNHAFDTGLISTGKSVLLINKSTREVLYFRSLAKASEFLGRSHSYLSDRMRRGVYDTDRYHIRKAKNANDRAKDSA